VIVVGSSTRIIGVSVLLAILVSILTLGGLMMKTTSLFVVCLFVLAACGDSYRYPCQDPAKAYTPECSCTPRTKNKALSAVQVPTTDGIRGIDC
jgi:hypothetical protein